MSLAAIIGLIAIGFLLVLLEIFLIPGIVIGILGALAIAVGIGGVYASYGVFTGNIVLLLTALSLGLTIVLAFRAGFWKNVALVDKIEGKTGANYGTKVAVGDTGVCLSALRPAGTAYINDQKVEVHTEGEFLLVDDAVQVIKIINNRIIVQKT